MNNSIKAVLQHSSDNDQYYFFNEDHYTLFDKASGTKEGYPLLISDEWHGLSNIFPGPYDTVALNSNGTDYFFFKGDQYVRYSPGKGVDKDYPKMIENEWGDLYAEFPPPYDACFYAKEKYFFFKGENYVSMSPGGNVDGGFPKAVAGNWRGLTAVFEPPYDAVTRHNNNSDICYFFKDGQYVRYQFGKGIDNIDKNAHYPRSTDYFWPGVWQLKPLSAVTLGAITPEGPLFSVRLLKNELVTIDSSGSLKLEFLHSIENLNFVGYTHLYRLKGMNGKSKTIELKVNGEVQESITLKAVPKRTDKKSFKLAMGSCFDDAFNNRKNEIGTLENLLKNEPDFMVWNGDTSYYIGSDSTSQSKVEAKDMKNQHRMFQRMFKTRHHPSVVKVVKNILSPSTWDDHDFGFNNSNRQNMTNRQIRWGTEVFKTCWPNSYDNKSMFDSINHSFRYGVTEFFFPDSRTHREPEDDTILGNIQIDQLIKSMRDSDALLKVLVCSSQLIPSRNEGEGFFNQGNNDRKKLLALFEETDFKGRVLVLSGDVHYSELSFYGGTAEFPKVIEVTSSPLLLKNTSFPNPSKSSINERIWSAKENAYSILNVNFVDDQPQIEIDIRNDHGSAVSIYEKGGGIGKNWGVASAMWEESGKLRKLT